jgi:uncharacterized protein (DUF2141 family)
MWTYMRHVWRENNGGWLLLAGIAASLLLGFLWRWQLIPDIKISKTTQQPLLSQTIARQNSVLVAQIMASDVEAGSKGLILLFRPENDPQQPPAFQQSFRLDDSAMTTVLMVLPPGTYSVFAFLDKNDNGQLDFEGTVPLEPMKLPSSSIRSNSESQESGAEVTLVPQIPVFCLFRFDEQ